MNYGVGDEVICIDAIGLLPNCGIVVGGKYIVESLNEKCAGFVGMPFNASAWCYECGDVGDPHLHNRTWRFIKLPKLTIDAEQEAMA